MTKLIHILGSDVPHHNQTILHFFNKNLAPIYPNARKFMIVQKDNSINSLYSYLVLKSYSNRLSLIRDVITKARKNCQQHFFFHGQFNIELWLALLFRCIKPVQFNWHIWGADLYEDRNRYMYKLLYLLRRKAQKYVGCVFANRGDLNFFSHKYPNIRRELLYFPIRVDQSLDNKIIDNSYKDNFTILLGNSGSRTNAHISSLKEIYKHFGNKVNIVIPMGYPSNNYRYINQVYKQGLIIFSSKKLHIITDKLDFEEYLILLKKCNLGYFNFIRQQGIGTIYLLIQIGIPCVLNRRNPFCRDMNEQGIPILFTDEKLNKQIIFKIKQKLQFINKQTIKILEHKNLHLWHHAIDIASGK